MKCLLTFFCLFLQINFHQSPKKEDKQEKGFVLPDLNMSPDMEEL